MKVNIPIKQDFEADISIDDIIEEINYLEPIEKLRIIGNLLNEITLEDMEEISIDRKKLITSWLDRTAKRLK